MLQFLLKRLIGLIFVVLCVTFITFILGYLAPGDPIKTLLGSHFDPITYAQLRHQYGLDLPWYQQYYNFLVGLFHFDFGYSFHYQGRAVLDILSSGLPISLELGVWGLFLTILIGIPIGIFAALRANTWVDTATMGASLVLYALPTFVLAVFVKAISDRDYPVIQATAVLGAVAVVLGNLISDLLYTVVDPRIKAE